MIDLIIKTGYEDDGVDGFDCLHCKSHISMRINWSDGILYCPYCGTKFQGAWIYRKRRREIYWAVNNHPSRCNIYWQLQSKELDFHSDGTPFNNNWDNVQQTYRHCTKAGLLKLQKEIIEKFKTKRKEHTPWGSRTEFKTRLVYIREYPNQIDETSIHKTYGKKVIVSVIKETLHTIYPKKKKKIT